MANTTQIEPLIGNAGHGGYPFGRILAELLTRPTLTEAIVASAYLTVAGSDRLAALLATRKKNDYNSTPTVTVIIGTKNRFTRKLAVRNLINLSKKRLCPVDLNILRPKDDNFHLKACWFLTGRKHYAIVGSHNLTETGLESRGELGVFLHGKQAMYVRDALRWWEHACIKWSSRRPYQEAKQTGDGPGPRGTRGNAPEEIFESGETGLASDSQFLSEAEQRTTDAVLHRLSQAMQYKWTTWFLPYSAQEAREEYGYYWMSLFDSYANESDTKDWFKGQRRGIYQIYDVVPVSKSTSVAIMSRSARIRYKVDPEVYGWAKRYRITTSPSPKQMRTYMQLLIDHNKKY